MAKLLRESIAIVDQWAADTAQLTGVYWQWKSGAFADEILSWLRSRLSQVLEMRSVVHQLSSILSAAEIAENKVETV